MVAHDEVRLHSDALDLPAEARGAVLGGVVQRKLDTG